MLSKAKTMPEKGWAAQARKNPKKHLKRNILWTNNRRNYFFGATVNFQESFQRCFPKLNAPLKYKLWPIRTWISIYIVYNHPFLKWAGV
jgi:hypothetical protein